MVCGAISVLGGLIAGSLSLLGWWQWQKDGGPIESPSQRHAVWPAVIVHPRLRFGLVMSDRATGEEAVVAGWTRGFPWSQDIRWTADDRLRIEYFEQNSLHWARKTELLGVKVEWIPVAEPNK